MQIFTSLDNLALKDTCVAIGVFDGVHRGHQEILRQTRAGAEVLGGPAVALTFDPNPIEVLAPARAPLYLCSVSQRLEWMDKLCGLDTAVVVPFDRAFASLGPEEFVVQVLSRRLSALRIFVGADFRYGRDRAGSVMDLEAAGQTHGFEVAIVHPISEEGHRVSSTRIRQLVAAGEIDEANKLLGHPFTLRGTVVEGKRLGRTLGVPTANLDLAQARQQLPSAGVYAGYAILSHHGRVPAAISVGTNPTTDADGSSTKVEAYLMDGFDSDLYGQNLDIEFLAHIRPERKFGTVDDLVAQMQQDVKDASVFLLSSPSDGV